MPQEVGWDQKGPRGMLTTDPCRVGLAIHQQVNPLWHFCHPLQTRRSSAGLFLLGLLMVRHFGFSDENVNMLLIFLKKSLILFIWLRLMYWMYFNLGWGGWDFVWNNLICVTSKVFSDTHCQILHARRGWYFVFLLGMDNFSVYSVLTTE